MENGDESVKFREQHETAFFQTIHPDHSGNFRYNVPTQSIFPRSA